MSYRIVVDSCCELPEELLKDPRFVRVPLGIEVGDYRIQDDDDFDHAGAPLVFVEDLLFEGVPRVFGSEVHGCARAVLPACASHGSRDPCRLVY